MLKFLLYDCMFCYNVFVNAIKKACRKKLQIMFCQDIFKFNMRSNGTCTIDYYLYFSRF